MRKNGTPSYNDWEWYLMENKKTGIKDKWEKFLEMYRKDGASHKSGEISRATAQEVFRTIRDLFVNNSSDVNDYYRIEGFKASVRLSSKKTDKCLAPIIEAIADLKKEISSRTVERKCVRRKGGIVWMYGMTPIDNNGKNGSNGKKGESREE